jgi:hypothetical protein
MCYACRARRSTPDSATPELGLTGLCSGVDTNEEIEHDGEKDTGLRLGEVAFEAARLSVAPLVLSQLDRPSGSIWRFLDEFQSQVTTTHIGLWIGVSINAQDWRSRHCYGSV